jgi:hypothetical protein
MENNVKITILQDDYNVVQFIAEADFDNDTNIYTEMAIDENSELIDFDEDEKNHFYSTSLGYLLEKYLSVGMSKIKNESDGE